MTNIINEKLNIFNDLKFVRKPYFFIHTMHYDRTRKLCYERVRIEGWFWKFDMNFRTLKVTEKACLCMHTDEFSMKSDLYIKTCGYRECNSEIRESVKASNNWRMVTKVWIRTSYRKVKDNCLWMEPNPRRWRIIQWKHDYIGHLGE